MLSEIQVPAEYIEFCEQWHDGQDSMLYAIASTGNLTIGDVKPIDCENEDDWQLQLFSCLELELARIITIMLNKPCDYTDDERMTAHDFHEWAKNHEELLEELYCDKYSISTIKSVCENCGKKCEYDSEICLCSDCDPN